jgi:hypothetical protein
MGTTAADACQRHVFEKRLCPVAPESRLVQPPIAGLMPCDAPPLREPLPPEPELRALRDGLDPQLDDQPPIVAEPLPLARRQRRNAGPARKKTTKYKGVTAMNWLAPIPSAGWMINGTKL